MTETKAAAAKQEAAELLKTYQTIKATGDEKAAAKAYAQWSDASSYAITLAGRAAKARKIAAATTPAVDTSTAKPYLTADDYRKIRETERAYEHHYGLDED